MATEVAGGFALANHVAASSYTRCDAFGAVFTAHLAVARRTDEGADVVSAAHLARATTRPSNRAGARRPSRTVPPRRSSGVGTSGSGTSFFARIVAIAAKSKQRSRQSHGEEFVEDVSGHNEAFLCRVGRGGSNQRAPRMVEQSPSSARLRFSRAYNAVLQREVCPHRAVPGCSDREAPSVRGGE